MAFLPAWAPIAVGIAGLATSAYAMVQQGNAASSAANYQAQVARNNAQAAQQKAAYAAQAAEQKATTSSMKAAARVASIKAAQAAGGVDVNRGSSVDVRAGTAALGQLDTETERHNALLQAYGYRSEATSDEAQARLDESRASSLGSAGGISAAATLLGGSSSLGFKWQSMQKAADPGSNNPGMSMLDGTGYDNASGQEF